MVLRRRGGWLQAVCSGCRRWEALRGIYKDHVAIFISFKGVLVNLGCNHQKFMWNIIPIFSLKICELWPCILGFLRIA
jgi:hypothetical protein